MTEQMNGRAYDWNDTIEHDSSFVLLTPGDYDFTVVSVERGYHQGSDKLPPCNKATVSIEVTNGQQKSTIKHNLMLHSKCEGLLCEFFLGCGLRKHGEPLRMDFPKAIGCKGKCKVGVREWKNNKTGEIMQGNDIKKFYAPEETKPQFTEGTF